VASSSAAVTWSSSPALAWRPGKAIETASGEAWAVVKTGCRDRDLPGARTRVEHLSRASILGARALPPPYLAVSYLFAWLALLNQ
jgi:hypothetical protein